jgi:hypothetical protein
MGVAAGDVSGDGRLDLFVTNYRDEANTLYVQEADRSFSDSIRGSGLLHAGLPYIGWGTQCLDADNDGDLDLVVANGHVGYFERDGVQERMPTQLFGNRGAGRFEEVPPDELGAFFNRAVMGRSLATLDWDRDGRTECVLSLLDENVAVLKNQSTETGNWLAVRLIGTASARDAIGTVVTIHTQDGVIRRQLTAGDGYQATNERVLRFGLGDCDSIEKVTIEWPGEQMQTLEYVPANTVLGVVEGRRHMTLWTGTTPAAFND